MSTELTFDAGRFEKSRYNAYELSKTDSIEYLKHLVLWAEKDLESAQSDLEDAHHWVEHCRGKVAGLRQSLTEKGDAA